VTADASSGVFAVVTGGGTSGHVLPALAIADALVARGHAPGSIHYVGTERGVERTLLPPTGYPFTLLDVVGLQRSLSRRNLMVAPKAVRAVRAASRLMAELRPRVVVNVGGYASFPMSFVAKRHGVPLVVVSYDRRPGLVSRLMSRRAAVCAVAFDGSPLPNKVLTGAPIRAEMVTLDRAARRAAARDALGLPQNRFVVAVMCGSLGAQRVNEVVGELVDHWRQRTDMAIFHVVGERFVSQARPELDGSDGIMYAVKGYERRMADLYAAADLLVTRGGAGTISELATVGAPAVIVPWPGAAENHQLDNARTLSDNGAAITIEQSELDVHRLAGVIDRLHADPAALAAMAAAAYAQGARHRDGSLVDAIERVAR
jgi:UDP-N-acetylglucosamine--N-acetylmuramyl-(pentapeptide) pyrophosphoryl-undecaprenol N-acetylglucosamine transferase